MTPRCVLCGFEDDPELLGRRRLWVGGVQVDPDPWVCLDEAGCYQALLVNWVDSQ